ncbi:glycosyltransferase family 2 protein [Phyllobacterium sp. SB3]|uniref:glycosyltransferase family 2 protein n=1 Tax=Phyllobacterium sp. SB3 TaxID=3156073 RepID=UPI0032B00159
MPLDNRSVTAIIVSYNPDLDGLKSLLGAVIPQVGKLLIIDNGSKDSLKSWLAALYPAVDLEDLGQNYGIAKAQNVGIAKAKVHGAGYVLLLDQDSIPAQDMVSALLSAAEAQLAKGNRLACVGPRYEDPRQKNPPPFIKVTGLRLERQICASADSILEVDYLISSGCLIPLSTLDSVGGMREELFIDYVDIEWGLRAKQMGYQSYGVCSAHMKHDLGDNPKLFLGRHIPVHSPLRHYYHFRNAIWLYRQQWLRLNWKMVDLARLARKFVFYSLITAPRAEHARMMTLGIWHGLTGKMGKKISNG